MSNTLKNELTSILECLAEDLDVSPSKYKEAKEHYEAVGNFLNQEDSSLAKYKPEIYRQGSFALGTAVKPLGDDDYDVDAVCLLQIDKSEITQQKLKQIVGDRLKEDTRYAGMLDPKDGGRRCWTLKYADGSKFHLDILPAIPNSFSNITIFESPPGYAGHLKYINHLICITDKETWHIDPEWPTSNPRGYAQWFKEQMLLIFKKRQQIRAMEIRAEVEKVPDYEIRTPLQRIVQLLKRHRDLRYNGNPHKPRSIIITTLTAQAYNNEEDLMDALDAVIPKMRDFIENRNGEWWIPNPVNPEENFADRWKNDPKQAETFFEWFTSLEILRQELLRSSTQEQVGTVLARAYDQPTAHNALKKYASKIASVSINSSPKESAPEIILSEGPKPWHSL